MIGRQLNHYKVLSPLGKGGKGEVYLAEDSKLRRKVALKVLPSEMAEDPDLLARFQREARAVAALNHPNIVAIHSVEEAEGVHFITMELVEGVSLYEHLTEEGLSLEKFLEVAVALAETLSAAHSKAITTPTICITPGRSIAISVTRGREWMSASLKPGTGSSISRT